MRRRFHSLAARLIATAAIVTMLGLAGGGFVLSNVFRTAALNNLDLTLTTDMDGLIAAAEVGEDGGLQLQDRFFNRQFDRVYSGLYFEIMPARAGEGDVQISRSLFDRKLNITGAARKGALTWGYAAGPDNQHLRVLSRRVDLTPDESSSGDYTFLVAGNLADADAQIASFNSTLIVSFLLLGAGLVLAVFLQVRVGLLPLRQVSEALGRIRDGKAQRLEGEFPAEIAPLAGELNSLIAHSAEVVARARTHVSNLAHFLKTPLSVLSSEAEAVKLGDDGARLAASVKRQVFTMRRQVDHYLTRARASGNAVALGNRTHLQPVIADLSRVLERIHQDRGIVIEGNCPPDLFFRGERQDLEEMAGNLIDNACKWAHGLVQVTARREGAVLTLTVEDDGPGLSPEERLKVGTRGERLDESVPGSGLGLAIVRDISSLYGGFFALDTSPLGGLLARLTLPAIR